VDYIIGGLLSEQGRNRANRKLLLIFSIVTNLGLLAYFKYTMFAVENINLLFDKSYSVGQIILPIGISFYTFQSMSYTIDIYYGRCERAARFSDFAAYVSAFPQLIAGPIIRASEMLPQFEKNVFERDWKFVSTGLYFFVLGLFKKVCIADKIAEYINPLFVTYEHLSFASAWVCALGFTLQLYFDFSGYCDMATGLGRMLGLEIPQNFNSPYKSTNISEFWRRWHMTLSRWLRDYLYIPLGGSKKGTSRTLLNLIIVMGLGGLWHGANWNYVVWGLYMGLLLIGFNLYTRTGLSMPRFLAQLITFFLVVIGWVMFRSEDLAVAEQLYIHMFGLNGFGTGFYMLDKEQVRICLSYIVAGLALCWFAPNTFEIKYPKSPYALIFVVALLGICLYNMYGVRSPFLYFQF